MSAWLDTLWLKLKLMMELKAPSRLQPNRMWMLRFLLTLKCQRSPKAHNNNIKVDRLLTKSSLHPQVILKHWQLQLLEVLRRRTRWTSIRLQAQARMAEWQRKTSLISWVERHNQSCSNRPAVSSKLIQAVAHINREFKQVVCWFLNYHLSQESLQMISKKQLF